MTESLDGDLCAHHCMDALILTASAPQPAFVCKTVEIFIYSVRLCMLTFKLNGIYIYIYCVYVYVRLSGSVEV